jgi:hypothetical protein
MWEPYKLIKLLQGERPADSSPHPQYHRVDQKGERVIDKRWTADLISAVGRPDGGQRNMGKGYVAPPIPPVPATPPLSTTPEPRAKPAPVSTGSHDEGSDDDDMVAKLEAEMTAHALQQAHASPA